MKIEGVSQEGRDRFRIDHVQHHPDLAAPLQPLAQRPHADAIVGDPPGSEDEMVDAVEGLGRRRQGTGVNGVDVIG